MSSPKSDRLFLGVDVGTGSARAALFTAEGRRLGIARRKIETWNNPGFPEGSFEQSTEDIWRAVCEAARVKCHVQPAGLIVYCDVDGLVLGGSP